MQIINIRAQKKECGSAVSNWIAKNNAAKNNKEHDPLDHAFGYPFRKDIAGETDECYTIYKGGLNLDKSPITYSDGTVIEFSKS